MGRFETGSSDNFFVPQLLNIIPAIITGIDEHLFGMLAESGRSPIQIDRCFTEIDGATDHICLSDDRMVHLGDIVVLPDLGIVFQFTRFADGRIRKIDAFLI